MPLPFLFRSSVTSVSRHVRCNPKRSLVLDRHRDRFRINPRELLHETLDEEKATDQKLTQFAEKIGNPEAKKS